MAAVPETLKQLWVWRDSGLKPCEWTGVLGRVLRLPAFPNRARPGSVFQSDLERA